jgi:type I restriction-modification system DNA methylase subunit
VSIRRVLSPEWKERLGLSSRRAPEFYESPEAATNTPHALAIRAALDDLGLSAMFCVQGVPTIAIQNVLQYDESTIVDLHARLWNQGLASLLLVIAGDVLRVFSLARTPQRHGGQEFQQRCLIETLNATAHALKIRNLIYGAESGRIWKERAEYFSPKERIDQVLLDNLITSHKSLCQEFSDHPGEVWDAAQALLIQTMFIAYLEDRDVITGDYFKTASRNAADSFKALLGKQDVKLLNALFAELKDDFNGDLFVAPCSFELRKKVPALKPKHLEVLARFRTGQEDMAKGGQLRFWGYDFRYIPIELVSAVYDRFLGEREEQRKEQGAYYTPMYLADTVVSQIWDLLPPEVKDKGQFLDPACGSGVFLVRSFQRLCEHWRATHRSKQIRWPSLIAILRRIHGWDINSGAVRVAVFSLYVALLEEVDPPNIRALIKNKKVLPELWGSTLVHRDFFDPSDQDYTLFEVLAGNPPWTSRRGPDRSSVRWCEENNLPMPGREDAWAFVWKALRHLRPNGLAAFLLPSMGFLHNHAENSVAARNELLRDAQIQRIINFADLRFQLFDGPIRPTALILFAPNRAPGAAYRFDYWAPKADLNLQIKRVITLSSADKLTMTSVAAQSDALAFKRRLWMREPEAKLFNYLARLPKLGSLVEEYGTLQRRRQSPDKKWVVGVGYQPYNESAGGERPAEYSLSKFVGTLPDLPIEAFLPVAQVVHDLRPASSRRVRRKGFEAAFMHTRILVPRTTSFGRLRACYVEEGLTFQDIIQGITVPPDDKQKGKLLTALLNSRVAAWYAFHGTASFGSERPEVKQAELRHLPFPSPKDLPEPKRAIGAARELIALVDREIQKASTGFVLRQDDDALLRKIDSWTYDYYCLSDDEIIVIEDTIESILPAVQPHRGSYPDLWKPPTGDERRDYATTLIKSVGEWMRRGTEVRASLEGKNADLAVLRLSLNGAGDGPNYVEHDDVLVSDTLAKVMQHIRQPLDGNFLLMPDLRVFIDKRLYLVKPMQRRFWLRSTALSDADAIASDLQYAIDIDARRDRA